MWGWVVGGGGPLVEELATGDRCSRFVHALSIHANHSLESAWL